MDKVTVNCPRPGRYHKQQCNSDIAMSGFLIPAYFWKNRPFFIPAFTYHPTGSLLPTPVELQDSLFHPLCRFVGFPVLVHALTYMEQTRLFAVLYPHIVFIFIDAEADPAVQAFGNYSAWIRL